MHFLGSHIPQGPNPAPAGGAANNGIFDNDYPFTLEQRAYRVELDPHGKIAHGLGGLDKGAAHVMIADHPHFQGNTRGLGIAYGCIVTRVGKGHDKVGLKRRFPCQDFPHTFAGGVDVGTEDVAVRPGKIDLFKNTVTLAPGRPGKNGFNTVFVDDKNLTRFHVPHVFGRDQVQGTGLGCHHMGAITETAQAEWSEAVGVAYRDHGVRGHEQQGVGTANTGKRFFNSLGKAHAHGSGHEMDYNLTVHGCLEDGPLFFQVIAQVNGVHQVAVMGDSQRHAFVGNHERLGVDDGRFAGGGIADMAHGQMTGESLQVGLCKYLRYQAHILVQGHPATVAGNNPGAFLAPMLQGV